MYARSRCEEDIHVGIVWRGKEIKQYLAILDTDPGNNNDYTIVIVFQKQILHECEEVFSRTEGEGKSYTVRLVCMRRRSVYRLVSEASRCAMAQQLWARS